MQTICKLQIHCPIGIFAYLCRRDSNYKRIYEKGIIAIGTGCGSIMHIGPETENAETCRAQTGLYHYVGDL
jgi:hypothetical protein